MSSSIFSYTPQVIASTHFLEWASSYGATHCPSMTRDVHRITSLFMALNGCALLYNTFYSHPSIPLGMRCTILVLAAAAGVDHYFFRTECRIQRKAPETFFMEGLYLDHNPEGTIEVNNSLPQSQQVAQSLHIAQLIQLIAFLCLSPKKGAVGLQLAGVLGSYLQRLKMDWVEIAHTSPAEHRLQNNNYPLFGRVERELTHPAISYYALLPEASGNSNASCGICLEEAPDSYYCSQKHRYCKDCLIEHYVTKVKELALGLFDASRFSATLHYSKNTHGIPYLSHIAYSFRSLEKELPRCPSCRETASHPVLSLRQGAVAIKNEETNAKSNFWASFYLLYTIGQLAITILQHTHPHLTGTLYSAQKWLLPLDLLAISTLAISEAKMFHLTPEEADLAIAAFIFITLSSFGLGFYHMTKPYPSLAHLLKDQISEQALATLTIKSKPPAIHRVMTWSYASRLLIIATLMTFSTNKKVLLTSALMTAAIALQLSKMRWVSFERTLHQNLPRGVSSATPQLQVLIPNLLKKGSVETALKSTLLEIYDFTSAFFQKSQWNAYWSITKQNGAEINRRLCFNATITANPLVIDGVNFYPLIQSWGGFATTRQYGTGSLSLIPRG